MTVSLSYWYQAVAATNRHRLPFFGFVRLRAGECQGPEQRARCGEDIQLRSAEREAPIGARVGRGDGHVKDQTREGRFVVARQPVRGVLQLRQHGAV